MKKVQLTRNLRKIILRGHPWVYGEALQCAHPPTQPELVELLDQKKKPLAWGIYDPEHVIQLRLLSTAKKPPNTKTLISRLRQAYELRSSLRREDNTCYRLVNGEGDLLPGFVCDVYGSTAVVQFDGLGMFEFYKSLFSKSLPNNSFPWIDTLVELGFEAILHKSRFLEEPEEVYGEVPEAVEVLENGCRFYVELIRGQKTGFFLDQRDNREFIRTLAQGKSLLNLFSYTGGFSIAAGVGGAQRVTSVDIAGGAIENAARNWQLNGLNEKLHQGVVANVADFVNDPGGGEAYDIVVVDPPSMAPNEKVKPQAIKKYIEIFSNAARLLRPHGTLVLSSCSSHISFEDFYEIAQESLSGARLKGRALRYSGQGMDHPFPLSCPELRYLKFLALQTGERV